jgi:hypothetical protein
VQERGTVKHGRRINRTFAYWSTKGILVGMFIVRMIRRALAVFDKQVAAHKGGPTRPISSSKEAAAPSVPDALQGPVTGTRSDLITIAVLLCMASITFLIRNLLTDRFDDTNNFSARSGLLRSHKFHL